MFNLPDYPDVYTTRHITCVSCKEKFAVTEGHPIGKPQDRRWRVLSHETSRIDLRQEDNRQKRPVVPQPLQIPAEVESSTQPEFLQQPPAEFTPYAVHCPRCGADNRNWLSLQNKGNKRFWQKYYSRFPQVIYPLILVGVFIIAALRTSLPLLQQFFLIIGIPLAIWGLVAELTSRWNKLREGQHIARVKPDAPNEERALWIRGFAWVFHASVLIPLVIFVLAPRSVQYAIELVEPEPEETVVEAATAVGEMVNQDLDATASNLKAISEEMDDLLANMPTDASPQFEREVATFSEKLSSIVTAALNELNLIRQESPGIIEGRRDQELGKISEARADALEQLTEEVMADIRFLIIWAVLVGLPTFISVFFVMAGIKSYIKKIDGQLPPPIFHSVAGMTRIVSWEAKQALEIEGTMHHIQWVDVKRNEEGGITLIGLHRELPSFDATGQAYGEMVRAQKHVIKTDMWGRIIKATIYDTRVPRPAGGPEFVMALPLPHDAPVHVRPPAR